MKSLEPLHPDMETILKPGISKRKTVLLAIGAVALFVIAFIIGYFVRQAVSTECIDKSEPSVVDTQPLRDKYKDAVKSISAKKIDEHLKYFTKAPHPGGSPLSYQQALHVKKQWENYGLEKVELKKYNIALSFPQRPPSAAILDKDMNIEYEAARIEKTLEESEHNQDILPPLLAYTASGEAKGKLVYANYGRDKDFKYLKDNNISCKDAIVIMRYGKGFRGYKTLKAQTAGAKGVIIYSDPREYSLYNVTDLETVDNFTFPHSWMKPSTAVERGTTSWVIGDHLTPELPSTDGMYRRPESEIEQKFKIPAIPMSFKDAFKFLKLLENGTKAPDSWHGGLTQLKQYGLNMDPASDKQVLVNSSMKLERRDVYHVVGTIRGAKEPDRLVLIGNHRDAWTFGGVDPSSGTACLMEVARVLGEKRKNGWRPRRTVGVISWGAEEHGLMGSMEWAEEFFTLLRMRIVTYLNVDSSVNGNYTFRAKVSPQLREVLAESCRATPSANGGGESVFDEWLRKRPDSNIQGFPYMSFIAAGSDYGSLVRTVGVPCYDIRYTYDSKVWPYSSYTTYHTSHDTYFYVKKFLDPNFYYHQATARVWVHTTLSLADVVILPFYTVPFADSLDVYVDTANSTIGSVLSSHNISLDPLFEAVKEFRQAAVAFDAYVKNVDPNDAYKVRVINDQLTQFERAFISKQGMPGRNVYKHVLFSSTIWNAYTSSSKTLPGVSDAIHFVQELNESSWGEVHKQVSMVLHAIRQATYLLKSDNI